MPRSPSLASEFVEHLRRLNDEDRAAMACLRRSLSRSPGAYAPAYPYVEPFVGPGDSGDSARRTALYVTAGLFAMHPEHKEGVHYAEALAELMNKQNSKSIEKRFVALLESHPEDLHAHLRHATSLLASHHMRFDYTELCQDLMRWYDVRNLRRSDWVKQKWARKFYSRLGSIGDEASSRSNKRAQAEEEA
jgi:CRISPR system Cascade subunit CasB